MPHYPPELINQLTNECCEVIDDLLNELGVDYHRSKKMLFGPCPIHGGDNPTAWNLYPEGDEVRGIWICRTHHCEKKWKKSLVGFIHAVLSRNKSQVLPWTAAVEWMLKFLGYKNIKDVKAPTAAALARQAQANAIRRWNVGPRTTKTQWTQESIRKFLQIPSEYYINRGYKRETLEKYDVGFYPQQNRVLVPIYDTEHKLVTGFCGRSIFDRCDKCKLWHAADKPCPTTTEERINASKWKNSKGFEAANFLYNYWFAHPFILETSTIILVEGPGDVWRLEEAGIHNAVGLFGIELKEEQLTLLESSWAINVVVLLDNDEAGINASQEIKKRLQRTHRLFFPAISAKDVGELQTDTVTADIEPLITQIKSFSDSIGIK